MGTPWNEVEDLGQYLPEKLLARAMEHNSDIGEHIGRMHELAKECSHITECGVNYGVSSAAWLASDAVVRSYDIKIKPEAEAMFAAAARAGRDARLTNCSSIEVPEPEDTDLLFIDTDHTYALLRLELEFWHARVRKYIILHDTTLFEFTDQMHLHGHYIPSDKQGLWTAVEEFLAANQNWIVKERYLNCNGITVLQRVA